MSLTGGNPRSVIVDRLLTANARLAGALVLSH